MGGARVGRDELGRFLRRLAETAERAAPASGAGATLSGLAGRLDAHETMVYVLGEVTRGKSTLVNALLGDALLPARPRPTTRMQHVVRYGPDLRVVLETASGERRPVPRDELMGLNDGMEEGSEACGRVVVEHPSAFLRDGLVLVDTPGVNDLNEAREELLYKDLPAADAALMVLDARHALTRTEGTFLLETLPSPVRSRLILVLTKADRLDEKERVEVMAWVREGLEGLGLSVPVHLVAARSSLEGDDEGSGVPGLRSAVTALVASRGGAQDALLARVGLLLEASRAEATARLRSLEVGQDEAKARQAELEGALEARRKAWEGALDSFHARVGEAREAFLAELSIFGSEFARAIPASLAGASAEDVRTHLPFFIRDTFGGFVDGAMPALQGRLHEAAAEAAARVEEGVAELERAAGLGPSVAPGAQVHLSLESGLTGSDVGVAVLGLMGAVAMFGSLMVGGLLTAAAAAAAMQFRRHRDERVVEAACAQAPSAVVETRERLAECFEAELGRWEAEAAGRLTAMFDGAVGRLRSALAAAAQQSSDEGRARAVHECRGLLAELGDRGDELAELRGRLAGGDGGTREENA